MVRVLGHVLAAFVLVLLQSCAAEKGGSGDQGGQGAPLNNDGGEAPGAPIDIPAITVAEGQPLDVVRAQLQEKLREACGGEVCVDIEVAETDENHETCQYSGRTDPPAGTEVRRGSTVTLIMGSQPCTDADGDGVPDDTDGDDTPDLLDDDANGDGIPDAEQSPS